MKTAAIITVLISSFSAAFLTLRRASLRCENIYLLTRLITVIRDKAQFYSQPFAETAAECEKSEEFKRIDILSSFSREVSAGNACPEAWRECVEKTKMCLSDSEKEITARFGEDMCSCSREKIGSVASAALSELEECAETAAENRDKTAKTKSAIILAAGLIATLLSL